MAGLDRAEEYFKPSPSLQTQACMWPKPDTDHKSQAETRPEPGQAQPNPAFYELYGFSSHCLYFVFTFECIPVVFDPRGLIPQVHTEPYNTCSTGNSGGCRTKFARANVRLMTANQHPSRYKRSLLCLGRCGIWAFYHVI